ncbi:MAG: GPP34 family phosphoprotein [Candidatus Thermoplasmatota archaeon]
MRSTLAEELFLVALVPQPGERRLVSRQAATHALVGAVLLDLESVGRIEIADMRARSRPGSEAAPSTLHKQALSVVGAGFPEVDDLVWKLPWKIASPISWMTDELRTKGWIEIGRGGWFGWRRADHSTDLSPRAEIVAALQDPHDVRTRRLALLLDAVGGLRGIVGGARGWTTRLDLWLDEDAAARTVVGAVRAVHLRLSSGALLKR